MSEIAMKPKVTTSFAEQETVINIAPADGKVISIYTCQPKYLKKLWKLASEHPDEVKVIKDDKYGSEFEMPESWLKFRPKRQMTEEQRDALRERFAKARGLELDDEDDEDVEDQEVEE